MTQHGRHRAPVRHAHTKSRHISLGASAVAAAAVLLTGGVTAANSEEQAPPFIDVVALENDATVTYDIRNHEISIQVITKNEELEVASTIIQDASIATGSQITKQEGQPGEAEVKYQVKLIDGNEVSRIEIDRTVITEAVPAEIIQGTGDAKSIAVALKTAEQETGNPTGNKKYAKLWINQENGWGEKQFACLEILWFRESNWNHKATNPSSGAYGIPQSLPGQKMATVGADWRTNPATQIKWGTQYIEKRYGTPCEALDFFYDKNWY
jgi:resuscitation-promoting factor RpfB